MATLLALLAASQIDKVLGPQTVALRYLYRIKLGKLGKKKKQKGKGADRIPISSRNVYLN